MTITKKLENTTLTLSVSGRLDTTTAVELENALNESLGGVTSLILDLSELAYMSSAGLRVVLKAQKTMNAQGEMKVVNVNEVIMEVFEITGFADILTIE